MKIPIEESSVIFSRNGLTGKGKDSEALKSSNYLGKSAGMEVDELPVVESGNSKIRDLFSSL